MALKRRLDDADPVPGRDFDEPFATIAEDEPEADDDRRDFLDFEPADFKVLLDFRCLSGFFKCMLSPIIRTIDNNMYLVLKLSQSKRYSMMNNRNSKCKQIERPSAAVHDDFVGHRFSNRPYGGAVITEVKIC